jgi:hypothetical protein
MTSIAMSAREIAARLEGELLARRGQRGFDPFHDYVWIFTPRRRGRAHRAPRR